MIVEIALTLFVFAVVCSAACGYVYSYFSKKRESSYEDFLEKQKILTEKFEHGKLRGKDL